MLTRTAFCGLTGKMAYGFGSLTGRCYESFHFKLQNLNVTVVVLNRFRECIIVCQCLIQV